jgi:hypothetical protein
MCARAAACDRKNAQEVHGEHVVPVVLRHGGDGLVDRDARVVDQNVETPVGVDDLGDRATAVAGGADVAAVRRCRRTVGPGLRQQACDELVGTILVAVVAHRDRRALIGKAVRDRRPDPTGAAGDEGHAPRQLVRGRRVRLVRRGFQYVGHGEKLRS